MRLPMDPKTLATSTSLRRRIVLFLAAMVVIVAIAMIVISFITAFRVSGIVGVTGDLEQKVNTTTRSLILTLILPISGVLLILAVVLGTLFAKSLTNPLQQIIDLTQKVGQGKWDLEMPHTQHDEIGQLASAVQSMVASIQQTKSSLEQRIAERTQTLEKRTNQLQIAANIRRESDTIMEFDLFLQKMANLIHTQAGFYHVGIFLTDDQDRYAVLRAATGEAGQAMLRSNHRVRVGDASIVGNVSHSGNSRIINNVQSDFAYVKHPLLPETHSEASLPIKADGRVIGVLDVYSRELNAFDQNDLTALQVITDQLATSIQNRHLSDNLRQSPPETSSTNQDITQDAWTHSSKLTAGYEYDQLRVTSIQRALPPEILSQLQSGRAITLTSDKIGGEGTHPTLVVPLMMYNKMIGILGMEQDNPNHEWTPEEITLVEAITNQAALALDNARLLEETQLRTEQIRLLQEITATAASTVNLTELIEAISQKVQQGFNILYCGLALTDPNSKTVLLSTCAATQGATGADIIKANLLRSNHEILKQVTDSGQAVKIYNAINYPALRSVAGILKADSINTIVVIPVRSRGEVIGTLSLYESNPEREFEEDEIRLLDQIALQTAGGIEVARSFEQAIQRAERERQISEVITKMRESLDIDTVLRTAAREIRATLNLDEVKVQIGTS